MTADLKDADDVAKVLAQLMRSLRGAGQWSDERGVTAPQREHA